MTQLRTEYRCRAAASLPLWAERPPGPLCSALVRVRLAAFRSRARQARPDRRRYLSTVGVRAGSLSHVNVMPSLRLSTLSPLSVMT